MSKLLIVIPAHNEEENIASVVEDLTTRYPQYDYIVVNDGSRDSTGRILEEYAAGHPLLVHLNEENRGHGGAVLRGYRYAVQNKADYVFQTDSDGQTRPEEFEAFWNRRREYAMVIGWRSGRQDGCSRVIVTRVLRMVLRLCFHVSVKDANTPYRLMEAGQLRENLKLIPDNAPLSNVLLSVAYVKQKQPVAWLPITFRPRQGGVNSINLKKIFRIGRKALGDFISLNRQWSRRFRQERRK